MKQKITAFTHAIVGEPGKWKSMKRTLDVKIREDFTEEEFHQIKNRSYPV